MNKSVIGVAGCLGVLVIGALIVAGLVALNYNSLVRKSQEVDARWADVQNVYQRRADLIPNLVNTVKGAANFEQSTLTQVTQARASVGQVAVSRNQAPSTAAELENFQQAQGKLDSALSRLLVVVERYPELKANANFQTLQAQLEGTENRIAVERRNFNRAVQGYDTALRRFPTVLFASMLGFKEKPYFTAQAGAETAPKVDFNFGTPATAPSKP